MAYIPMWRYRAEEIKEIARQVKAAAPDVWAAQTRDPSDPRFPQYVAAACNSRLGDREIDVPGFGPIVLRGTDVGVNGKRGSDVLSDDVLSLPNPTGCLDTGRTHPGLEVIDIVNSSGSTNAGITFADVTVKPDGTFYTPSKWFRSTAPVVGAPGGVVQHNCKLGALWFWEMAAFREHRQKLDATWVQFAEALRPQYVTAFVQIGGISFRAHDGNRYDPWERAGSWLRWPDHGSLLEQVTDYNFDKGAKTLWKLLGGTGEVRSLSDALGLCRHFVRHMTGRWGKVEAVEGGNEFDVNQIPLSWLQAMGVELRRLGMPENVPYSISSPNLVMGFASREERATEVTLMYGPRERRLIPGALAVTPHWDRSNPVPPDMGIDCPEIMYANEPRGPDMSTGGDIEDPQTLAGDYQAAVDAGYTGYTASCDFLIWDRLLQQVFVDEVVGGRCGVITEHPTWSQCCIAWRRVADGFVPNPIPVPGPGTSPGPTPTTGELRSGQSLLPEQTLVSPGGHARLHYQSDGNLVVYLDGTPIWSSRTPGETAGSLLMQPDGNLVLSDATGPIRSTRTEGHPGAMVQLQDDGNFTVYDDPTGPSAGTPLWASATSDFL